MRTLYEITEGAKDEIMPTHTECYHAMLALLALGQFDSQALRRLAYKPVGFFNTPKRQCEESFNRRKLAFAKAPDEWLGPDNIPGTPEHRDFRKIAKNMLKVVEKRMENKYKKEK